MSMPNLCQSCHQYHHATIVNTCPFCADVHFPEEILCDLVRDHEGDEQAFHCEAFRPTLSVVHHDETEISPTEDISDNTMNLSPKEKWFRAYGVQQLGMHPDLIAFTLRYHVVLSTRGRTNLFSSAHREPMADVIRQAALPFEQTTVHVVLSQSSIFGAKSKNRVSGIQ